MDFNDPLGANETSSNNSDVVLSNEVEDISNLNLNEEDLLQNISKNKNISNCQPTGYIPNSYKEDLSYIIKSIDDDEDDLLNGNKTTRDNNESNKSDLSNNGTSITNYNSDLPSCDDDEYSKQISDIKIIVDSPDKYCTTLDAFITFKITVKSTREEFNYKDISVRRRYNDFLWLYQKLEQNLSHYFIPPLPEKHNMKCMDRFDEEFISTRCRGLQRFLSRIACHPVLSFDPSFIGFISFNQTEFQNIRKEKLGFLDRLSVTINSKKTSMTIKCRPENMDKINNKIEFLCEKLSEVDRNSHCIIKEQLALLENIDNTISVYNLWANIEQELKTTIDGIVNANQICFTSLKTLVTETSDNFCFNIKEYYLYTGCVKDALRIRDVTQNEYDISVKDNKVNDHNILNEKDANDKDLVKNRLEYNYDNMVKADDIVKSEAKRWDDIRRDDFKNIFTDLANSQIKYYKNCLNAWESMLLLMQQQNETKNNN